MNKMNTILKDRAIFKEKIESPEFYVWIIGGLLRRTGKSIYMLNTVSGVSV
jgi:hypothetical protein